ncbi:hypothetical protein H2204_008824 [Knufia peltigerae]|uniref:Uncharacterized protein n=1 Tax=Knufia peltigerae TaxID=1002370 RepID=A0AA39CVJ9_9EURO|nr:hypothetical protein H2204_008824 [Knufia peltigerae]
MASVLESFGFKFINYPGSEAFSEEVHCSQAVIVPPHARTVTLSGQVGVLADGSIPNDLTTELDLCFQNVKKALIAAGLGENACEYIYDATFYFKDQDRVTACIVDIMKNYFGNTRPAVLGFEAGKLAFPDSHVEMKVTAFVPPQARL